MTQEEIIEMAIGMGLEYRQNNNEINTPYCDGVHIDELQLFAKLVADKEREACAKVCESLFDLEDDTCDEAEKCAVAIRARGKA